MARSGVASESPGSTALDEQCEDAEDATDDSCEDEESTEGMTILCHYQVKGQN